MLNFVKQEVKNFNMPPKRKSFVVAGFTLLIAFIMLSLVEEFGGFYTLDPVLTTLSQTLIPRSLDTPLSFFSLFGSLEVTTLILAVLALIVFKQERLIPYSFGLFALVMVVELIAKLYIYHPSPPSEFFRYALPFTTPHYISSTYSFPSGHVARTIFLAVVTSALVAKYIHQRSLRIFIIGLILGVCLVMLVSRVYLGEHWASDVLGGLILGAAFGFLAMVYYAK